MPGTGEAPGHPAGFASLGPVRLELRRAGPGSGAGPTIVLLHEGLGSAGRWGALPEALSGATGLPVLAYSRAGYGASSPIALPRPPDFLEREAREVLPALLDAVGLGACILVGHSDGATIAALAAAAGERRIRAAALIAPHFFVEAETLAGLERARTAFERGDLRRRLARHHADVEGAFRGWNEAWLDPARRAWDVSAELARITVPVAVIQGERDAYGTGRQVDAVRRACPRARIHLLPGLGHVPHEEDAPATLAILAAFVGDVGRSST